MKSRLFTSVLSKERARRQSSRGLDSSTVHCFQLGQCEERRNAKTVVNNKKTENARPPSQCCPTTGEHHRRLPLSHHPVGKSLRRRGRRGGRISGGHRKPASETGKRWVSQPSDMGEEDEERIRGGEEGGEAYLHHEPSVRRDGGVVFEKFPATRELRQLPRLVKSDSDE